jgi:hypothetical protein
MAVDITRRHDLSIHLDISFPSVPCAGEPPDQPPPPRSRSAVPAARLGRNRPDPTRRRRRRRPAALSLDVVDASGTMESDVSSAKGFNLHKVRVDDHGNRIGKSEYYTPQSHHLIDTGSEMLMSIDLSAASKVRPRRCAGAALGARRA